MKKDSSHNFNRAFLEAPAWSQKLALAKAEFLELGEEYIRLHEASLGRTRALNRFLHQFNRHDIGEDLKDKLRNPKISKRTYQRWLKAFKEQGIGGLTETYNNGGLRIDTEVRRFIEKLIWENHLARFKDIFDDLSLLVPKEKMPSYYAVRNYAKAYRKENWAALVLKHEGVKGLRDRDMQVVLGRRDQDIIRPNQLLEFDSTWADLFTKRKVKDVVLKTSDGRRCKIIGVIDVYSRMAKLCVVDSETALAVGLVLKYWILKWGLPEEVSIDNGKPYKNDLFLRACRGMGISIHICLPGNPVEKPFIERFFRNPSEELFRRLPGYSGNCVANKPNEIEVKYSMQELQDLLDRWITNVYAERIHRTTGQRPRERMSPPGFVPKTINERDLDILLMECGERKVQQGHIKYKGGRYFHSKLPEGQKVSLRLNHFDASELIVYFNGKYIGTAVDVARKGMTPSQIIEARKSRNKGLKTQIAAHEAFLRPYDVEKAGIINLIDRAEKKAPVVLQKKADVVSFPENKDIKFTRPGLPDDHAEDQLIESHEDNLITDNKQFYFHIKKKKLDGKELTDYENNFLEEFLEGPYYETCRERIDREFYGLEGIRNGR